MTKESNDATGLEQQEVLVASFNIFKSRNLEVCPELLGLFHQFEYEGYAVKLSLPSIAELPKENDLTLDSRLRVDSYRIVEGQRILNSVSVFEVYASVSKGEEVTIPRVALTIPPRQDEYFSPEQADSLNAITAECKLIAEAAFDRWLRVLRWKCRNSRIGRPYVSGIRTGLATHLFDVESKHHFWSEGHVSYVEKSNPISVELWTEIQKALNRGIESPIHWDLFFDAEESLRSGDLRRSVVDLAISCESFIRSIVMDSQPGELHKTIKDYIARAQINTFIKGFMLTALSHQELGIFEDIRPKLNALFERRNSIMHKGETTQLLTSECREFLDAADKLLSLRP